MGAAVAAVLDEWGGTKRDLARELGLTTQALDRWFKAVPARHALAVERITGVPRCRIRPDLYPADHPAGRPDRADGAITGNDAPVSEGVLTAQAPRPVRT